MGEGSTSGHMWHQRWRCRKLKNFQKEDCGGEGLILRGKDEREKDIFETMSYSGQRMKKYWRKTNEVQKQLTEVV